MHQQLSSYILSVYVSRLYHHIKLPSELRQGHDYAVFKQGIRPMWEDDANKMGGRWLVSLEKKQRNSDLDRFWLDTVSCADVNLCYGSNLIVFDFG